MKLNNFKYAQSLVSKLENIESEIKVLQSNDIMIVHNYHKTMRFNLDQDSRQYIIQKKLEEQELILKELENLGVEV